MNYNVFWISVLFGHLCTLWTAATGDDVRCFHNAQTEISQCNIMQRVERIFQEIRDITTEMYGRIMYTTVSRLIFSWAAFKIG